MNVFLGKDRQLVAKDMTITHATVKKSHKGKEYG
jgi:hypothetical protein